jgi:hypothetical protein
MAKHRKFYATFTVEIDIAPALLKSVLTDEWRSQFYPFMTPEDVAEHLAFNLIQGRSLSLLDGFADQDPKRVTLGEIIPSDTEEDPG